MDRIRQRLEAAKKAQSAFAELANLENPNDIERDAAIQRFEFTFEATWKVAKHFLYDVEGVDAGSPKSVIRSCREVHLFNDEDAVLALEMVNDRNLAVHTYNEEVAIKIQKNLPRYNELLNLWIMRMNHHLNE